MTGIDISEYQLRIPPGDWDSIICRVTHDRTGIDKRVAQHFPNAIARTKHRGVYHFWNPTLSSGAEQAKLMAQNALAIGFRKGVDLWALDSEAASLGDHARNAAWVREFFVTGRALLGDRRLWYVGWPYYVEHFGADQTLLREQAWWLPAYGPNDGHAHEPQCPFAPALHQFTSRGGPNLSGLDVNRVMDVPAWAHVIGASPAPAPKPPAHPKVKPVIPTKSPLRDVNTYLEAGTHREVTLALTEDGGIFAPKGKGPKFTPFTPVGQPYWKGRKAMALAVAGDPTHPLTKEEVAAGKAFAVVDEDGNHYAFGPK